MTFYQ